MKITLIGAGNVATHLARAFVQAQHEVVEVVSRTQTRATELASQIGCKAGTTESFHNNGSDLYVISVKDDAVAEVAQKLIPLAPSAIWAHTAGSLSMDVLYGADKCLLERYPSLRIGVFYPMQTFSKKNAVDFNDVSLFIESTTCQDELTRLARTISPRVYQLDSAGRKRLHLAAVFACNFVNHCYALSQEILQEMGLPFDVMIPLIDQTALKVHTLSPQAAQTGPAARGDQSIMSIQKDMLSQQPTLLQLYSLMSDEIMKRQQQQ